MASIFVTCARVTCKVFLTSRVMNRVKPTVLLVIDVQTCFFEGANAVPNASDLLGAIKKVVENARRSAENTMKGM